jgi:hypothetical protein
MQCSKTEIMRLLPIQNIIWVGWVIWVIWIIVTFGTTDYVGYIDYANYMGYSSTADYLGCPYENSADS